MVKILEYQPFQTLYLVYFLSSRVFIKAPFWLLRYLLPSQRPRPVWTLKRSLIIRTLQELLTMMLQQRTNDRGRFKHVSDSSLTDAKFVRFEGIPESDSTIFCGEIRRVAEITGVKPVNVAGYWLLKKGAAWDGPQAKAGERIDVSLGFISQYGTAHPSHFTSNISRGLLEHSQIIDRTFSVDYRLTASAPNPPANPFPAAIIDALAAYRYLVQDCGFEPKSIVLAGDSAGGNLAIALARHLVENTIPSLPPPGRLFVVSPWIDLLASRDGPNSAYTLNGVSDIFTITANRCDDEVLGAYTIDSLRGPLDLEVVRTNRYFSPAALEAQPAEGSTLFKGFMETYVVAGGAEKLLDDSKALVERLQADGVKVHVDISPDAAHDFLCFKWHEPERTETLRRVCQWIDGA
uniref:MARTX n=1 Tax=Ganoderma boninense TaxID=34458 RepID=A0A5K1JT75_9APHY|nr:MARTX [Ganoderma boninense]